MARKLHKDVEYKSIQLIWDKGVFNAENEHELSVAKQWCLANILHDARQDGIVMTPKEELEDHVKYLVEKPKEYPDMIKIIAHAKLDMYM